MPIINPHGKEIISVTKDFHGRPLTLEVNRVGFRSTASVLATYGDTVVIISRSQSTMKKNFTQPARLAAAVLLSVKAARVMKRY
jgi:hypothetical protein